MNHHDGQKAETLNSTLIKMISFNLYIVFVTCITAVHTMTDLQFTKLEGKHGLDDSYVYVEHFKISSSIECGKECINDIQCWSYGFHELDGLCRLVTSNLNETQVQGDDEGWNYFVGFCKPSWTLFRNSCYKVETDPKSFEDAQSYCFTFQSHLIKVDDEYESLFSQDIVKQEGNDHFWIGLSDENHEGVWLWYPSLQVPSFTDWNTFEPTNTSSQNCVLIHKTYLLWHDFPCGGEHYFICEAERLWK